MGGLWKHIKITYAMMWIGSLALAGFPIFAGYYSKDMILEVAYAAGGVGQYAYIMGMAAAILTAFYSWRLIFMTFHGKPRADHHVMEHVHESPMIMLAPLVVLAIGAVFAGFAFHDGFIGHHWKEFWGSSILILDNHKAMEEAHHVPFLVKVGPIIVGIIGIFIAWIAYIRDTSLPHRAAAQQPLLHSFLLNKWYFDELYDRIFVRPAFWLGRVLWKGGDGKIIDGLGPDGFAATVIRLARRASILQTGYVYHYAFAMLIGVAALVTYFFSAMGH